MAKGKIFETVVSMAGEISPTLGKSLQSVQKQLEGVNLKAIAAGAAVGAIAVGTAKAVTDLSAKIYLQSTALRSAGRALLHSRHSIHSA